MKKLAPALLVFAWCMALSGFAPALGSDRADAVVRFRDHTSKQVIDNWVAANKSSALSVDYRFHTFPALLISAPADKAGQLERFAQDPVVQYVSGGGIVELASTPDDPLVGSQWWAANDGTRTYSFAGEDIDAIGAWDHATGSSDVLVAVIDWGMDIAHPDLAANCLAGYDFRYRVPGVPIHPHGTACAGLIGAVGNNATGMAGLNWDVSIIPFRMYTTVHAAAAIDSAVAMGARVISNSWAISGIWNELTDAITAANQAGVIVVNAAGNQAWDLDVPGNEKYPASYNFALNIAVANSCWDGGLTASSNWGMNTVDIAAPGRDVLTCGPDATYVELDGTSFSAPLVAGALALLISEYPTADPQWIVDRMIDNAEDLYGLTDRVPGGRRLNVFRMFDTSDRTSPAVVTDLQVSNISSTRATLTWTAPGDDGMSGPLDHYEFWRTRDGFAEGRWLLDFVPVGSGQTQVVELGGLGYGADYIFHVIAVDDARNRSKALAQFTTLGPPAIEVDDTYLITYASTGEVINTSTLVRNMGEDDLAVQITGAADKPWLTISAEDLLIAPGDSATVVFTVAASGVCGSPLSATLSFNSNDPMLSPPQLTIIAVMAAAPEISSVDEVDFGYVQQSSAAGTKIKVHNIGCSTLTVSGVGMQDGTYFSTSASLGAIPAGGYGIIQIAFNANQPGLHEDVLLITSDSPFKGVLAIPVSGYANAGTPVDRTLRCSPNPFNPRTQFSFVPETDGSYRLDVFDVRGALVQRFDGEARARQRVDVDWNGMNRQGTAAPSGIYFCTLLLNGRRLDEPLKINLVR